MKGHTKRNRRCAHSGWIVMLAALLIAPAAWADHDDWDDDYDDNYDGYYEDDDYDGNGYGGNGAYYPDDLWSSYSCRTPYEAARFRSLAGHGQWRWVSRAGGYLWFPHVATTWRPYYYGHWIHTSHGMTWVSYEPWGDVPHHYGQWVYVDHVGWGWVPGYDYAPAWVTWGVVDGYVGWAPLPPRGYRHARHHRYRPGRHHVDYGFSTSFGYHSGLGFSLWVFVSDHDFYGSSVYSHAVPVDRTLSLFKKKKVLPVGRSLHVDYVRKVSKRKIDTVRLDRRKMTLGGRDTVFHEPRGQKQKVHTGRDAAKRVLVAPKSRRDDVRIRREAPVKSQPTKVWTEKRSRDDRRQVASAERKVTKETSRDRSRSEKVTKESSRDRSRSEKVTKERTRDRGRSEEVAKKQAPRREQRAEREKTEKTEKTRKTVKEGKTVTKKVKKKDR